MNDDLLKRLAADYNEPTEPDAAKRDELWQRIQSARAAEHPVRTAPRATPRRRTWVQVSVATAAVLLLGILIGRWSMPDAPSTPVETPVVAEAPVVEPGAEPGVSGPSLAQRLYTRDVLLRTETLLTEFRLAAAAPLPETGAVGMPWASGLLLETRMLIDSQSTESPELTRLLRDLELILAEIVQLTDSADERERKEIRQSLEDRGVMLRLRNAVPAKVGTKGA